MFAGSVRVLLPRYVGVPWVVRPLRQLAITLGTGDLVLIHLLTTSDLTFI